MDVAEDSSRDVSTWAEKVHTRAINGGKRPPEGVILLARACVRVIWRCCPAHTAHNPRIHGGAIQLNPDSN